MKKTLYLMRHGQTLFNLQLKIQGWCDSPLTELGQEQARFAGLYFIENKIPIDHAYASTSERACDTLELVTGGRIPYTRLKGLKDWNFGVFEGKDECLNPPLPYGDFFKQFGGETQEELQLRMVRTLMDVMKKEDHHVVLAVSHGGACANFARYWEQYNKVPIQKGIKNCTIFRFTYEDEKFCLEEIIVNS